MGRTRTVLPSVKLEMYCCKVLYVAVFSMLHSTQSLLVSKQYLRWHALSEPDVPCRHAISLVIA